MYGREAHNKKVINLRFSGNVENGHFLALLMLKQNQKKNNGALKIMKKADNLETSNYCKGNEGLIKMIKYINE